MPSIAFDTAHLLAGGLLVTSFLLLYQDRITATLNVFALQAITLALAVGWQAYIQDAPHLYVTAGIALLIRWLNDEESQALTAGFDRLLKPAKPAWPTRSGL